MLQRVVILLFAFATLLLRPGAGETVESVLHLAAHGHTAHDAAHADGATSDHRETHSDLEHGCAGHIHVCPCCAHPVMANASVGLAVPPAPDSSEHLALAGTRAGPEGTATSVFRPPIAA